MEKTICARDDLRLVINVPSYWGVNDDGTMNTADFAGDGDADPDSFDAYTCSNCDEWFTGDCAEAWEMALKHLTKADVL